MFKIKGHFGKGKVARENLIFENSLNINDSIKLCIA